MANIRTVWTDRSVQKIRTYNVTENGDGSITLTPVTGTVYEEGTPVNAENMNKLEDVVQNTGVALDMFITITQAEIRALRDRVQALEDAQASS